MPLTEMVAMIAVVAGMALGFIAFLRLIAITITHKTIRKTVETKPELAEEALRKLMTRREGPADDRLAIVLIAIGIAMAAAPVIAIDDPGMIRLAIAAALFPLLV